MELVVHMGEKRSVYRNVTVNPKVGRPRCWWEGNVNMILKLEGVVVWNVFM